MRGILMLAAAALPIGTAHAQDRVGRTFHYERSNQDGTKPVQVYFHRAAPDRIEVYKMVRRCIRSVLVTATIDPATGAASQITGAELLPNARSAPYATLTDTGAQLVATVDLPPGAASRFTAPVEMRPWHEYDYDLATLSAAFEARAGSRADYRFGMVLFRQDPARPGELVHWLGDAIAHFTGSERHLGRDTLRFEVAGPALGPAGGGPLWIDATGGQVVDVQWARPNHDDYTDFRLRLIAEEPAGEAAWAALLRRHFEGCGSGGTKAP